MTSIDTGQAAEAAVADELQHRGCKILARNWKTKVCEIDIVAKKGNIVYFVEVKFRSSPAQGVGLEYIGPQKLKKMHFAARVWVQNHNFDGDYRLLAAGVSTNGYELVLNEIIELV